MPTPPVPWTGFQDDEPVEDELFMFKVRCKSLTDETWYHFSAHSPVGAAKRYMNTRLSFLQERESKAGYIIDIMPHTAIGIAGHKVKIGLALCEGKWVQGTIISDAGVAPHVEIRTPQKFMNDWLPVYDTMEEMQRLNKLNRGGDLAVPDWQSDQPSMQDGVIALPLGDDSPDPSQDTSFLLFDEANVASEEEHNQLLDLIAGQSGGTRAVRVIRKHWRVAIAIALILEAILLVCVPTKFVLFGWFVLFMFGPFAWAFEKHIMRKILRYVGQ